MRFAPGLIVRASETERTLELGREGPAASFPVGRAGGLMGCLWPNFLFGKVFSPYHAMNKTIYYHIGSRAKDIVDISYYINLWEVFQSFLFFFTHLLINEAKGDKAFRVMRMARVVRTYNLVRFSLAPRTRDSHNT